MFDFSFSELLLIGVIALIVIGPERLPEVARTVGKYVGRIRRFVNKVRDDIEREVRQEELRDALKRHADLDEIKRIINDTRYTIEDEVEETKQHLVKARDDDPRGDFSQQNMLKEQEKEFENEDYGLTDHHDYADETNLESQAQTNDSADRAVHHNPQEIQEAGVSEHETGKSEKHDGRSEKSNG